jgi:hypothetical protein
VQFPSVFVVRIDGQNVARLALGCGLSALPEVHVTQADSRLEIARIPGEQLVIGLFGGCKIAAPGADPCPPQHGFYVGGVPRQNLLIQGARLFQFSRPGERLSSAERSIAQAGVSCQNAVVSQQSRVVLLVPGQDPGLNQPNLDICRIARPRAVQVHQRRVELVLPRKHDAHSKIGSYVPGVLSQDALICRTCHLILRV